MAEVTEVKTISENDSSLVSQCMDYTKQLASQGQDFKFSLSLPSGFNFFLDLTQEKLLPSRIPEKKRKSPSTLRRNAQRSKEFQQKKKLWKYKLVPSRLNSQQRKLQSSVTTVRRSVKQRTF